MLLDVPLYPGQRRALQGRGRELLLAAEPRAGASHLLRAMAVLRAAAAPPPGIKVVLAAPDDRALRETHMEGPSGVWAMLDPEKLPARAVKWLPGGVAWFDNGSTLQLTTWDGAGKRSADLLLLDDADELGVAAFQKLREKALSGPSRDDLARLVVVARRAGEGWVRAHWDGLNGSCGTAQMLARELPEALRGPAVVAQVESFGDWIERAIRIQPVVAFRWYPHIVLMVETAQRVIDCEISRLLVSAPPRYFKSLIWSRFLPAYFLSTRPHEWFSIVSATGKLAEIMSSDARDFYRAAGGQFRTDSKDKSLWRTPLGGGMSARGVGGWFLGAGYNGGVFDDPFPSWSEAMKPSVQEFVEDYFWNTFYGRREVSGTNPAWIVVNHQALAEGDLRGRLIKRERMAEHPPENWWVLNLPAIRRPRREPFPERMTVIPDSTSPRNAPGEATILRADGEALCPELQEQDVASLERLEAGNSFLFAATHQQEPMADAGGGLFKRWSWSFLPHPERLESYRERFPAAFRDLNRELTPLIDALMAEGVIPLLYRESRAWDIAASIRGEGDASASCRGGITVNRQVLWTDAFEEHRKANEVLDLIVETAQRDGPGVDIVLPDEPAGAGKIMVANFSATLENLGFRVFVVSTTGSKYVRASLHAGACFSELTGRPGRCHLLPGPWNQLFTERHHNFDGVTKPLDLVDATSYNFGLLDGSSFLTSGIA